MPITELPPVAKSFFTACKKCDAERYHRVLAHVTSTSAKVQCEVCGGKSTYKLPKLSKVGASSSPKSAAKKKLGESNRRGGASHQEEYDKLMAGSEALQPVAYSMKSKFDLNQKLNHPKFGIGHVRSVQPDKIEVVFHDEIRSLIHNRI